MQQTEMNHYLGRASDVLGGGSKRVVVGVRLDRRGGGMKKKPTTHTTPPLADEHNSFPYRGPSDATIAEAVARGESTLAIYLRAQMIAKGER